MTDPNASVEPLDLSDTLNEALDGWSKVMGMRFLRATPAEVIAELTIGPEHRQAYGIVHGGVYAGLIESTCSVGAALDAMTRGDHAVGLDNQTSFLHAVREGKLRATARPLTRGRRSQLWQADVTDEDGHVVSTGRVRLLCLAGGSKVAGEPVGL